MCVTPTMEKVHLSEFFQQDGEGETLRYPGCISLIKSIYIRDATLKQSFIWLVLTIA